MLLIREEYKLNYETNKWELVESSVMKKNYSVKEFHKVVNGNAFKNQKLIGLYRVLNERKNEYYMFNPVKSTVIKLVDEKEFLVSNFSQEKN